MQMTKIHKIIIGILVLLAVVAVYFAFHKKIDDVGTAPTTEIVATTTNNGVTTSANSGGYTVEQVPVSTTTSIPKPIPDLDRQVVVFSGAMIAPEAKVVAVEKIKEFQTVLKKDPKDFQSWLTLGIYQKMAGDYEGAIISWKYASKLAPSDYISVANVGNLYVYFMHDTAQGEIYYKEAIKKGPKQVYLYSQLSDVYKDIFKDKEKALAVINQGLVEVPNDSLLLQIKASLQ